MFVIRRLVHQQDGSVRIADERLGAAPEISPRAHDGEPNVVPFHLTNAGALAIWL
jgi:hypothetical protein